MFRNSKNNTSVKPMVKFCKVCQDAGKPESVYLSHFTRETIDINSKVTCPTLLALECRYCYNHGHTVKYCPILKNKNQEQKQVHKCETRINYNASVLLNAPKVTNNKKNNIFACLDGDFDEAENQVSKNSKKTVKFDVKESFPSLVSKCMSNNIKPIGNYAAVLIAPAPKINVEPKVEPINLPINLPVEKTEKKLETNYNYSRQAPWAYSSNKLVSKSNWAAMVESDDDDDDEDVNSFSDNNDFSSNYDETETNYDY